VLPGQYGQILPNSALGYHSIIGGNVGLQPEISTTHTVGLVLEPKGLRGFNTTIDWWDIRLNRAIAEIGAQTVIDDCIATGDPVFWDRIHRDLNGSLWLGTGNVDDRQANIGGLKVRGIDIGSSYSVHLSHLGSAIFEFHGSYVLGWITDKGGQSTPYDCAGLFGTPCGIQPRWKHLARATWNRPAGPSLSLQWRHTSGLTLAALDPKFNLTNTVSKADTKLAAQDYFDLATLFRLKVPARIVLTVGHPDVAVLIDVDAVREDQQPRAEALDELPGRVELQHRRQIRHLAGGAIEAAVLAAAFRDPDRLAVLVDVDGARGSPRTAFGQLEVVLDRVVVVGRVVGRLSGVLRDRENRHDQ